MKTSKFKVRLICGFRQDQEYSIDANEAHKAYYLFTHPDERGVFSDGLAILGRDIQRIVPDYHGTLGINPSHKLTGNDYNQLHAEGTMTKMKTIMSLAKEVAKNEDPEELSTPLIDLHKGKYLELNDGGSKYAQQVLEAGK